jgi:Lon protease-like protein
VPTREPNNFLIQEMTNFIPIFPLDVVVYPEEIIRLHIFEPRYKQLIKECLTEQKQFGMPVAIENHMLEFGTLIEPLEIIKEYEDGSFDIQARGIQVFRILEIVKTLPEKLYSGAIVTYPENDKMKVHPSLSKLIYTEVQRLYTLLNIENMMPEDKPEWTSYDIAHKLGFTRFQEYELLSIFNEVQRMEYLRRYFNSIMPEVDNIELLKSRINLN